MDDITLESYEKNVKWLVIFSLFLIIRYWYGINLSDIKYISDNMNNKSNLIKFIDDLPIFIFIIMTYIVANLYILSREFMKKILLENIETLKIIQDGFVKIQNQLSEISNVQVTEQMKRDNAITNLDKAERAIILGVTEANRQIHNDPIAMLPGYRPPENRVERQMIEFQESLSYIKSNIETMKTANFEERMTIIKNIINSFSFEIVKSNNLKLAYILYSKLIIPHALYAVALYFFIYKNFYFSFIFSICISIVVFFMLIYLQYKNYKNSDGSALKIE